MYGDGILINISDKSCQIFPGRFIKKIWSKYIVFSEKETTLYTTLDKLDTREGVVFPFRTFKYIFDPERDLLVHSNHHAFDPKKSIIETYRLSTGEMLWSYDLKELGTWGKDSEPYMLSQFSGIYENKLICTLQNGDILSIDIEKGNLIFHFQNTKIFRGLLQKKGSLFWGIGIIFYVEIDVNTNQIIKLTSLEPEYKRFLNIGDETTCWFTSGLSFFQDGLFYFDGGGMVSNIVAVMDPTELKVIDFIKIDLPKYGNIKDVKVYKDKIYCLDTKGNLYFIESEKVKEFREKNNII
jgi:hypothetical protein